MASCGGLLAKLILCSFNLLGSCFAVAIVLVGTRKFLEASADSVQHADFLGIPGHLLSTVLIVCGVILGTITLTGLIAAACESSLLLKTYVYFLALGCVAATGILGAYLVYGDIATEEAKSYFGKLMMNSSKAIPDMASMKTVSKWQKMAMCCGNLAPVDWHNRTLLGVQGNVSLVGYPNSCCGKSEVTFNSSGCSDAELLYHNGCLSNVMLQWYKRLGLNFFVGILVVLLLLLSLSCCLERDHQLADSKLVNQQYSSHLNSCLGPGRYKNKRGSRMLANPATIRANGSRRNAFLYSDWRDFD